MSAGKKLRDLLNAEGVIFSGGAFDAASAKMLELCGFGSIYCSGFAITGSLYGRPDGGFIDLTTNLMVTRHIARSVEIPVLADIDTGYGNAANVAHTVREFETIGAAGVVLEDQIAPKRCPGITESLDVISFDEAVGKVRAAVDARSSRDFVIVARTDSAGDEVLRRTEAFAKVGADMVVPISKAWTRPEDYLDFIRASSLPVCINIGTSRLMTGSRPELTVRDLIDAGCKYINFSLAPFYASLAGMETVLKQLIGAQDYGAIADQVYPHKAGMALVGVDRMHATVRDYSVAFADDQA